MGLEVFDDKDAAERPPIMAFGTVVESPPAPFDHATRVKAVMDAQAFACFHLNLCGRGRAGDGDTGGPGPAGTALVKPPAVLAPLDPTVTVADAHSVCEPSGAGVFGERERVGVCVSSQCGGKVQVCLVVLGAVGAPSCPCVVDFVCA